MAVHDDREQKDTSGHWRLTNTRRYKLELIGPLRLIDPNGADKTPRSAKVRGMLALLASTPGKAWTRPSLQDKLWSDRDQEHGRNSLRQALLKLRDAFAEFPGALSIQGDDVALVRERVEIDLFDHKPKSLGNPLDTHEFLAGIDIRDPEFDDWLRQARASLHARMEGRSNLPDVSRPSYLARTLTLAVLPAIVPAQSQEVAIIVDMIADRLAIILGKTGIFDVVDFRIQPDPSARRGADFSLTLRALPLGGQIIVSISVHEVATNRLVWGDKKAFRIERFGLEDISISVAGFADQLSRQVFTETRTESNELRAAAFHAMDAIDCMFRLESPNIESAASSLRKALDIEARSSYFALYAYLTIFRCEAAKGKNTAELREHADELAARALELDPHNGLSRSLLTHLYSFLFRDFQRADDLISPLKGSPPDSPFYYHSLATLRLYTGRLDEARGAAKKAAQFSQFNPYRYAFSTTAGMVETIAGNFKPAIQSGEAVLAMHGDKSRYYEPALRYLGAAYAMSGDAANARRIVEMIRAQSPGFDLRCLDDPDYPIPSMRARKVLKQAYSSVLIP